MKSLIVGDIHTKFDKILSLVDGIIEKNKIDEVVFLGDYVDDWHATINDNLYGLYDFNDWLQETHNKGIKAIVLAGNHDYAYISSHAYCSGHMEDVNNKVKKAFIYKIKPVFSYVVQNEYLCSHGGFLEGWCEEYLVPQQTKNIHNICFTTNSIFNSLMLFEQQKLENKDPRSIVTTEPMVVMDGLYACGASRGGYHRYSGPLWADKRELLVRDHFNFSQIVGHTPVDKITTENNITFCDTFSTYSNLHPIGDRSMLIVNNGNLEIV